MITLKVNDHDLVIKNGTAVIDTGINAVIDHLQGVINLQLGDWINSTASGIDWNGILGSGITEKQIMQIVRTRILNDGIVTNITSVSTVFDSIKRLTSLNIEADGTTFNIPV